MADGPPRGAVRSPRQPKSPVSGPPLSSSRPHGRRKSSALPSRTETRQYDGRVYLEWRTGGSGRCARHPAALGGTGHVRAQGRQVRLRRRAVRGVHVARGWRGRACMRAARRAGRRQDGADHRRAGHAGAAASAAGGVARPQRAAVRLLPARSDHVRRGAARAQPVAQRGGGHDLATSVAAAAIRASRPRSSRSPPPPANRGPRAARRS